MLLAFLMHNFAFATTKLHGNNKNIMKKKKKKKNIQLFIIEQKMYVDLSFMVFFFLCFMYHFVVVATTQLHSNYTNNNTKINVYKLLNFE